MGYFCFTMDFIDTYLTKHNFTPQIATEPDSSLKICIVIPCYNEPDLITSLKALRKCALPNCSVEVIVVINASKNSEKQILEQNKLTYKTALEWIVQNSNPKFSFHLIVDNHIPEKTAGVGFARKIGMDEAVYRLHKVGAVDGIICGFDADCVCDINYLEEIERHFQLYKNSPGASIYFEHPLINDNPRISEGIIQYELHLRYLNLALQFTGHPHAFHTVGSSFAVRAEAYVKQGGMNRRQAGEDFYFLQKIIGLGNYTEINSTRVIPSARISDRVPFGTGASMRKWVNSPEGYFTTYNLTAFKDIRQFLQLVPKFYNLKPDNLQTILAEISLPVKNYLESITFNEELKSIRENTTSQKSFADRFYKWFTIFRIIKYLNANHPNIYPYLSVAAESKSLLALGGISKNTGRIDDLLDLYRKVDRKLIKVNFR